MLAEFQPDGRKRPLQARPIKQNVWACIKRKSVKNISGSQTTCFRARFEHLNTKAIPRQPQRSRQTSHSRADNNDGRFHWVAVPEGCCFLVR